MTLETARQIVTGGFAFWFLLLSTAIHGLHKHDGGACGTCGGKFCAIELSGYASKSGSPRAVDLLESGNAPRSDFQLCPASESFKQTLECCTERFTVQIDNTESELYDPEETLSTSPFDCLVASPRAPPLSLT
jgi:hypothetical protein